MQGQTSAREQLGAGKRLKCIVRRGRFRPDRLVLKVRSAHGTPLQVLSMGRV